MEINHLKEFIMLAEMKNYSDSAEHLFIAQSTLSRHIFALEDELGVKLFERTPRKVELTAFGRVLLPYARKIVEIEGQGTMAIEEEAYKMKESLTIGTVSGIEAFGVMNNIAGFIRENRDISVKMIFAKQPELMELLKGDKVDLVIADIDCENDSACRSLEIHEERLMVMLPPEHGFASRKLVDFKDLANEAWILQDDNYIMTRAALDMSCKDNIKLINTGAKVSGLGTRELVRNGLGICLDTEGNAKKQASSELAYVLVSPIKKIRINMIRRRNHSEATARFWAYYQKNCL